MIEWDTAVVTCHIRALAAHLISDRWLICVFLLCYTVSSHFCGVIRRGVISMEE